MSGFNSSPQEDRYQVEMMKYSHSEVTGNTAQGRDNTMFNAPAELNRRVVEGNSATAGHLSLIQHFHGTSGLSAALSSRGGEELALERWKDKQMLTPATSGTPARSEIVSIPDITASLSQLGSSNNTCLPPPYDGAAAAAAWKQQTERYLHGVRKAIESIESVNTEISEDFHTLGDQTAGLTDFKDYQILFGLTVNELQLTGRIEEIFRTRWTPISPPARISEVEDITARLSEILRNLRGAKSHFLNSITQPALELRNLRSRRHRAQVSHESYGCSNEHQ